MGARCAARRVRGDRRARAPERLHDEPAAVVTAAVAPLLREPRITADRVSEALHGETLALLERGEADVWLRVRAGDGYHAWTHAAYLAVGSTEWAEDWSARATGRSRGAELKFEDQRLRLAVGARVALRRNGLVEAGDGRAWSVSAGIVRPESELRAGAGRIVHSALSRGGVASDDLLGETPAAKRFRDFLVAVRRMNVRR